MRIGQLSNAGRALPFALALIVCLPVTIRSQGTPNRDLSQTEQVAKVLQDLRSREGKTSIIAARGMGFRLVSEARFQDAWSIFKAILEISPRDQQAMYGGALALLNSKDIQHARELAEAAVESARWEATNPSNASRESDSLVLLGVILAIQHDNTGALKAVQRAVDLTPESFDAQFALGRALYGAGELSRAAATFEKAITIKPEDAQARFFLGTALEAAGEYDRARQAYSELIRRYPENSEGHLGLGVFLSKHDNNKLSEAIDELFKAVAIKPDLYEARIALGRALIKAQRVGEAIEHLNRAAVLAPENPEPHYQLAIAYRRLGNAAAAETEAAKVREMNAARRGGIDPTSKP